MSSLSGLQVDPRPVAIARIGLGIATLLNALEAFQLLSEIAGGKVALPVSDALPTPSQPMAQVYLALAVVAGVALTFGWHTSTAIASTTCGNVWVLLWDQQTYSSHRLLATLLVAYLFFAKSHTAWSVSAMRGATVPWWPQLLMMSQLTVCYFFAAVSKINITFLSGVPLSQWMWAPLPRQIFMAMAFATVIVELFIAFALWRPAVRHIAVGIGLLLHGSIVVLMRDQTVPLIAFSLVCVSIYPLFVRRPAANQLRAARWVLARA